MNKTELIVFEDNTIYAEVDYMDDLKIRLDIINGVIKEKLYYRNEHGGISRIDEFGCCQTHHPFDGHTKLLSKIIHAQIEKRKIVEARKEKSKEINNKIKKVNNEKVD